MSASIGVAYANSEQAIDELLRNADVAMYSVTDTGKGRYAVFEQAMYTALLERLEMEADLRQAVDRSELRCSTNRSSSSKVQQSLAWKRCCVGITRDALRRLPSSFLWRDQRSHLLALGCLYGQGYLFAQPITADEVTEMMNGEDAAVAAKRVA